uniref:FZ domain-containing protein n=1 Tax=Eptatretus burgeri TaxID=7764 RepID=A0A8C4R675_EPTBU
MSLSCDARSPDVSDSTWCQAVPAEAKVCRAPGRRDMRFPNLLAERRESHVSARALRWAPLLSSSCHPDVRLFLCAVLAPQCLDRFVQPCRSLCEVVRDACTISSSCSAVPEFGVWPSEIKCEAFPPGPEGCISETVNSISRRKGESNHTDLPSGLVLPPLTFTPWKPRHLGSLVAHMMRMSLWVSHSLTTGRSVVFLSSTVSSPASPPLLCLRSAPPHSLIPLFPHLWNQLPHPLQSHSSLQVFKRAVPFVLILQGSFINTYFPFLCSLQPFAII